MKSDLSPRVNLAKWTCGWISLWCVSYPGERGGGGGGVWADLGKQDAEAHPDGRLLQLQEGEQVHALILRLLQQRVDPPASSKLVTKKDTAWHSMQQLANPA